MGKHIWFNWDEEIVQKYTSSDKASGYRGFTVRTALSIPSVISMIKNIMAHAVEPGSVAIASG